MLECWSYAALVRQPITCVCLQTVVCVELCTSRTTHVYANNLGIKILRYPYFNSVYVRMKYTVNMAGWFS